MLERAALCIESSAQLFTRGIEPPVRSLRALGHSFWAHNGGNDLNVPPWWPPYLETVRQVSYSPNTVSRTKNTSQTADPPRAPGKSYSSLQSITIAPDQSWQNRRPYSRSTQSRQLPHPIAQENHVHNQPSSAFDYAEIDQAATRAHDRQHGIDLRIQSSGSRIKECLPRYSQTRKSSLFEVTDLKSSNLQRMIMQRPAQEPLDFQKAWALFVSLSDQQALASQMLGYLSLSKSRRDLLRALQTFSLINPENRSRADYDAAVRAAARTSRYSIAVQICQEALEKNLARKCRQILLVYCLSQRLWRTVATVWTSLFDSSTDFSSRGTPDWRMVDGVRELPEYLLQLCATFDRNDPVLRAKQDELRALATCLFQRVLLSHTIMGFITPRGLFELFHQFKQRFILCPNHYNDVLRTLVGMPRRRADIAVTTYRNFRFNYPDEHLSSGLLYSLIVLCDKARFPPYIFEYWLEELKKIDARPLPEGYHFLMWALAHQGNVQGVERLFGQLTRDHGPPKNPKWANPLLYTHAATGNVTAFETVIRNLGQSYGTAPDLVSWNLLFFAYSRSKEPRRAFAAFDMMDKKKVPPDAVTFGTLIGICSRVGDTLAARSLVDVAKDYGVSATDDMLAKVAHSYCLNGETEEAIKLALSTIGMGFEKPPVRIWNNLLRHHAFQADFPAIRRLQNHMKDAGVVPDEMTYATILTSLVRVKKTQDALRLLRSLHFDGTFTATSFHYSIIIHGFAMEKNRDMVQVIYREMQERFGGVSPSAQLSMLHTQTQRGSPRFYESVDNSRKPLALDVRQATSYMNKVMSQISPITRTTADPQPGFQRRPSHEVGTSIYPAYLARQLALNRQPIQAHELLNHYSPSKETQDRATSIDHTVEILTTRLVIASKLRQWTEVDKIWCKILQAGAGSSQRIPLHSLNASPDEAVGNVQRTMKYFKSVLENAGASIPGAMRYSLSLPFSFYMQALDRQFRHDELIESKNDFQQLGFALSSKNWNSYIQVLCRSPKSVHRLHAYTVFEEVLRKNTPPWRVLVSSKWVDRVRKKGVPVHRRFLEQIDPGRAVPTYFTMVFMASVFSQFRQQAQQGNVKNFQTLNVAYPQLCRIISRLPRIPDNVRRVVLMSKRPHPSPPKLPKYRPVLRGGIAGSKSLLDHVPAEFLPQVDGLLSQKRLKPSKGNRRTNPIPLSIPEMIGGETLRTNLLKEKQHDLETDEERDDRIRWRAKRGLLDLEQTSQDHGKQSLVVQDLYGDPMTMPKTLEREFSVGHEPSHKSNKVDGIPAVNDINVRQQARALAEDIRVAGDTRLSTFALADRTVRRRRWRDSKRLERLGRVRMGHFQLRRMKKRQHLQIQLQRRRQSLEAERRTGAGVRNHLSIFDHETTHTTDVRARTDVDLFSEPSQAEKETKPLRPARLTPLNWKGDKPADKLIEKLLPRRAVVPKSRGERKQQWLKSQEEQVSELENLQHRQPREGGQIQGRGRHGDRTNVEGESKQRQGEPEIGRRVPWGRARGKPDGQEKQEVSEQETGKPLDQWRWDSGASGFEF